ncbi:unnamed protein product [Ectocarpus sp. 4 AP-2014]
MCTDMQRLSYLPTISSPNLSGSSLPACCYTTVVVARSSQFSRGPKTVPSMHDTAAETASSIDGPKVPHPPKETPTYTRMKSTYAHAYAMIMRDVTAFNLHLSSRRSAFSSTCVPHPSPSTPNQTAAFMRQKTLPANQPRGERKVGCNATKHFS